MYCLLAALRQRQAEQPIQGREIYLFLLGVGLFFILNLRVNEVMNLRFSEAARTSINYIVRRLPRMPLLEYEALGRGTLMTRILGDGNQVASARQAVFGVLSGGLRLLLGGLFAMTVSTAAAMVAFGGLVFIALAAIDQQHVLRKGFGEVAADDARMYELLRGQVEGGVAVKVHQARARALGDVFEGVSERVRALRTRIFTNFYERQVAGDALVYGLLGINVFVLPLVFDIQSEAIRALNFVTLWLVLGTVKLVTSLPRLSSISAALSRLRELEAKLADERLEPTGRPEDLDGGPFKDFKHIRIEDLSFTYPDTGKGDAFPLGPIHLDFRRGELVFITGHNGSGKSTFTKLLAALYRPTNGSIRVDGVPLTDETLVAYRSLFATIFVEHCLFDRTHGLSADAEIRAPALLEQLGIAGKTSIVGGRVTNRNLSTGQKKRLAMVLARLSSKPILLLDEWAADQDPEFRAFFYEHLLPQLRDEGRLVIVVTHDDNYFDRADRCVRFDGGLIAEGAA